MQWQLQKRKVRVIATSPLRLLLTRVTHVVPSGVMEDLVIISHLYVERPHSSLKQRTTRFARGAVMTLGIVLALMLFVPPGATLAHVDIDVGDGQYVMEVGFRDEPAYVGQPNALYLRVEEYATGSTEPVNDLAATLSAEVSRDGRAMNLSLVPVADGEYEAPFVPTATGDYTFRVFGTIGEAAIDESVTSGPSTFNSVEALSAIEFPVARPDPVQLQADITSAEDAIGTARTLGIGGIVAGLLGLFLGGSALARSRQRKAEPAARPSEPSGKLIR